MVPPTITPEASERVGEQVRAAQALDAQLRESAQPVIATRAMARAEPRRTSAKTTARRKAKRASTRG
jgi:hypothetical protein